MKPQHCETPWSAKTCGDCKHLPDNAPTTTRGESLWPTIRTDGRCCQWQARPAITPSDRA